MGRFFDILILGPIWPGRVARRSLDVSGRTVWMIHLGGWLLLAGLVCLIVPLFHPSDFRAIHSDPAQRWGLMAIGVLVGVVGGVCASIFLAFILICFAYRNESLRDTWRHAVRTVLLMTPALCGPALGLWFFAVQLPHLSEKAFYFLPPVVCATPMWALWMFIAALRVERPVRETGREPLCEECGYVLLHADPKGKCPECGTAVAYSLDAAKRWFPPRKGLNRPPRQALPTPSSTEAWFRPREFCSQLRVDADQGPVIRLVCKHLLLSAAVGYIILLGVAGILMFRGPSPEELYGSWWVALAIVEGVFGLWCVITSALGVIISLGGGRNLLGVTTLVAGYASGYFVFWAAAAAVSFIVAASVANFMPLHAPWFIMGWGAFNAIIVGLYVRAVWIRVHLLRYANCMTQEVVESVRPRGTAPATPSEVHSNST